MLNGLLSKNWWGPWDDFVLYDVILNVAVRLQTLTNTSVQKMINKIYL